MKKILTILFVFTFFSFVNVFPQSRIEHSSAFISGMVGTAKVSLSGNGQQNPTALAFGGSFGLPITKNLYLYTRSSYTSKSNFQSFYNTAYLNSSLSLTEDFVQTNSSFSQLLINGGLLYNIRITEEFVLGLNGGLTFMVLNQEAKLRTGQVVSSIDNENIWGAFTGVIVEKSWEDSDVTTFFEAQYNYAESDALYRSDALNVMNYTFGIRYYLSGR
ncbi:MAG: hypothetical protein DRQ01_00755 [Ignavibacteriae bacterium]|nr:MAG: hypothetical protein DRQ01_00755 [Ignavibacteriota bacterium]